MDRYDITPDEAEQILNGRAFERDDLFEIRDFVRTAAAMNRMAPSERAARAHIAAIVDATTLEPISAPPPSPRSNRMRSILRSKVFKTFAGAIAAVVAMGGLAAAQTLPDPAQDAVASVAQKVGIGIPHSQAHEEKVKRGMDHDGDGTADDNGLHTGQTGTKRGADHDGDGVADDNGLHKGQNKVKTGKDHDGDGVADDNGKHKGETKSGGDDGEEGDDGSDDGSDDDAGDDNGEPQGPKDKAPQDGAPDHANNDDAHGNNDARKGGAR